MWMDLMVNWKLCSHKSNLCRFKPTLQNQPYVPNAEEEIHLKRLTIPYRICSSLLDNNYVTHNTEVLKIGKKMSVRFCICAQDPRARPVGQVWRYWAHPSLPLSAFSCSFCISVTVIKVQAWQWKRPGRVFWQLPMPLASRDNACHDICQHFCICWEEGWENGTLNIRLRRSLGHQRIFIRNEHVFSRKN